MHESLAAGIKDQAWDSSKRRSDVLSRARKVIERYDQPTLGSLYEKNGRDIPPDESDQNLLNVFYAARLCFRDDVSSSSPKTNRYPEVGLEEVFQGYSKEKIMQVVLRLKPEIVFVRTRTPSIIKMPIKVDVFSEMGVTGSDEKRRFIREFCGS